MPIGSNLQSSIVQGIFRDFNNMFKVKSPVYKKMNERIMRKVPDSSVRNGKYGWKNSVPVVNLWEHGTGRKHQAIDDSEIEIPIFPYEQTSDVHYRDIKHDQLGDIREHMNFGVNRFLAHPQKLTSEYMNAVSVQNPSLLKAYDGADLYSATDGNGSARFGRTGGNILTGFDRTVEGFSDFLYQVQSAYLALFDTTTEELLFGYEDVSFDKMFVVVPRTMNEIVTKVANVSYLKTDSANNVSEGNYFATHGKFDFYVNPLLTDENSFFVFLDHPIWKAFVYRQEESIDSIWADMTNSDLAREKGVISLFNNQEMGCGILAPFCTFKVTA